MAPATQPSLGQASPRADIAEGAFDFWLMVHRALRGRYRSVAAWGVVLALVGGLVGTTMGRLLYSSTGLVRVAMTTPALLNETDQNKSIPNFDGFIQAQRDVMTSREIIEDAMDTPPWRRLVASGKVLTEAQFAAGLKVESRPRSDYLKVTYTNRDPSIAGAAVQAVILAYEEAFTRRYDEFEVERQDQLRARQASLAEELRGIDVERSRVADGADAVELGAQCIVAADRVKKLRNALADVQSALAGGPEIASRRPEADLSQEQIAAEKAYKQAQANLLRARNQLDQLQAQGYSPDHRLVRRLAAQLREWTERVEALRPQPVAESAGEDEIAADLPLREREKNLVDLAAAAESALRMVTTRRKQLADLDERAEGVRQSLQETASRLDKLSTEAALGGRLTIVNPGDVPMSPYLDNRYKTSALGSVMGWFLPFGACLLSHLIWRRSRYSMDVSDELGDRVPCVVALPNLNTSPSLAPIACNSMHDLRLRLQPRTASDRRTILVSSTVERETDSGLALSLALSFVAAGFRTLLIDGKLATKNLTTLLGAGECPGFGDATNGGEPLLWRTESGVAFLSAGAGELTRPLAPTATAKLLTYLSDRFDVVLIDGDSMAFGVNAPSLAPLVDGVVLETIHGEELAVLRNAANRVETLGGVLAGVAFDNAAAGEFEPHRAQIQASARSGKTTPSESSRFGPLVDAMTNSMDLPPESRFYLSAANISFNAVGAAQRAA